jgi:riboflavin kinase / FMN adenylyltransferase
MMQVSKGIGSLPLAVGRSSVTVGFFDGVHRGHQAVFRRTVERGRALGLTGVAVTFDRHPREVLTPGQEPPLLTSIERKAELIADMRIDHLVVLEFDENFSRWPPQEFVRRILVDGLRAEHTVVGSNFTFGHMAAGNLAMLADLGGRHGFTVEGVALLKIGGVPVSSSSIRQSLREGDLAWPTEALGRRFLIDGRVTRGAGRGAAMGFPTANLEVPPRMLIPGQGVYAGTARVPGGKYVAAINVGTNPTFGAEPPHVEAYLLDFDADIRGAGISVEFWSRLRDELRFDSSEDLVRQMQEDIERTRNLVAAV